MRYSEVEQVVLAAIKTNIEIVKAGKSLANVAIIPMIEGDPGNGKTSLSNSVARQLDADLIVLRLADLEPTDVAGWNVPDAEARFMKHVAPRWLPAEGGKTVIVLIDEMAQGATATMNVIGQVLNERMVGTYHIPDNVHFICAGNPARARAGTNHVPTHLRDRLMWLELHANVDDVVPYFQKVGVSPVICAYLRFRSEMLSKFDRDAKACPSPRSWERMNTLMNANLPEHLFVMAAQGLVGEGPANDFMGYRRLAENVPDMDALIADPENAPIPDDLGVLYAVSTELVARFDPEDEPKCENIVKYLNRMPKREIAGYAISDIARIHRNVVLGIPGTRAMLAEIGRMVQDVTK